MAKVYVNEFTNVWRKFEGKKGYVSNDHGKTWSLNGTPEELIQRLSYYKSKES